MPAYKDEQTNKWYVKFYYEDWNGERKQKKKRGFRTKKEALAFENNFLNKLSKQSDILFRNLVEIYLEDMGNRLKQNTIQTKQNIIEKHILTFFADMVISEITPTHIRKWQNEIIKLDLSETFKKAVNVQLVAIFSYAVKYYSLSKNPCTDAGKIGKSTAAKMDFWTLEEFNKVIEVVEQQDIKLAFNILYWCGLRIGELLALTYKDIDINNKTLTVNKSFQRIKKQDIITEPKTPKSNRVILLTDFLIKDIQEYFNRLYDYADDERIFTYSGNKLRRELDKASQKQGVKKIRIHDLRHSHVSLLIEMGFNPLLIAERLGHEDIQITLNTYSHLYPNKQNELINRLESLKK